jgi:hypothetical protein
MIIIFYFCDLRVRQKANLPAGVIFVLRICFAASLLTGDFLSFLTANLER